MRRGGMMLNVDWRRRSRSIAIDAHRYTRSVAPWRTDWIDVVSSLSIGHWRVRATLASTRVNVLMMETRRASDGLISADTI